MKIIITGTPGTGKSSLAKLLAKKLAYRLIQINKMVDEKQMILGVEDRVKVINLSKLKDFLSLELKRNRNVVIEGHLACEIKLPGALVVVTRTNPEVLRRRLAKRGYDKEKLEKNILCELLDYCTVVSLKNYNKVYEIDTSGKKNFAVRQIDRILTGKGKELKAGWVDWSEYLYSQLK